MTTAHVPPSPIVEGRRARLSLPKLPALARAHVLCAQVLLLSVCAWQVYAYVAIALRRMAYPFELEWMEGGILGHVYQVLQGESVYGKPSLDFTAYIYNPLYYYVGALSCRVFGTGLFALRFVSFVASVGCFLLVYAIVQRDTRSRLLGVFGATLFLATFQLSGAWFDIARVDSLSLFFTLAAIATAGSTRLWVLAVSGGLCALAFLTKQSACFVGPALFLQAALARKWRGALALGGAFAVVAGAATLVLQATSDGWYTYYAFELPMAHSIGRNQHLIKGFWSLELLAPLPIAATLGLVALLGARSLATAPAETASHEQGRAPGAWFLSTVAVILVLSAWATRLHMGSAENDIMPAHAALALLSGRGLSQLLDGTGKTSRTWIVVCGVAMLQLVLLGYEPGKHLPAKGESRAGEALVEKIRTLSGEVLVINHPHLNLLAGKKPHAHLMALVDIEFATRDVRGARAELRKDIERALRDHRFGHVIVDDPGFSFWGNALRSAYTVTERRLIPSDTVLWPKTGMSTRPKLVYSKKAPAPSTSP